MSHKLLATSLFLAILSVNAFSAVDTIIINTDYSGEKISRDLDSLVSTWYVK